jgi:hypothetical protein
MQVDRRKIESNLLRKGFRTEEVPHHRYFHHEYNGLLTGSYTYTSRGASYKSYGTSLLKRMKKQLRLDTTRQVVDLCKCPMSGDAYNQILKQKGLIPKQPQKHR